MTNDLVVFKRLYSKEIRRCSALSLSLYLSTNIFVSVRLSMIDKHNVFANSEVVWNVSVNQMKVDYRRGLAVATRVGRDMHTSAHTDMLVQTVTDAHETNTCLCTCGGWTPCQDTPKANMPSTQVVIAGLLFAAALDGLEGQSGKGQRISSVFADFALVCIDRSCWSRHCLQLQFTPTLPRWKCPGCQTYHGCVWFKNWNWAGVDWIEFELLRSYHIYQYLIPVIPWCSWLCRNFSQPETELGLKLKSTTSW